MPDFSICNWAALHLARSAFVKASTVITGWGAQRIVPPRRPRVSLQTEMSIADRLSFFEPVES
eukprot:717843-Pyramimonas_sp.AAC.1